MFDFFKKLLADDTGAPSTMRMAFMLVISAAMFIWIWLCIKAGTWVEIPGSVLTLIGSAFGAKVFQSVSENFSPSIPSMIAGLTSLVPKPAPTSMSTPSAPLTLLLAFALLAFAVGPANAQTINVAWNAVPGVTTYRLGVGPSSRNYTLTQIVTGTNGQLQLGSLSLGTNFLAVQVYDVRATNAIMSRYGNEVTILNVDAPAMRLSVTLETTTNLVTWTRGGPTANAIVSQDQSIQYFRPEYHATQTAIEVVPPPEEIAGTVTLNPSLP